MSIFPKPTAKLEIILTLFESFKIMSASNSSVIEDNIPWTEKYLPIHFDDIISHKLIKDIITKLINNNTFHHLILYGPPGIGKTTMMNSCLRYIYGEDYKLYILELNGSDDRGINIVRDEIKNYANSNNIYDKVFKLIIYGLTTVALKLTCPNTKDVVGCFMA